MAKKNKMTQIMAFLALFGIIIGIIGTGLLVFFSNTQQEITPEQYLELQDLIDAQTGSILPETTETLTGETN